VFDTTREIIAYGLIGLIIMVAIPIISIALVRRKRQKLRRRGIKTHGH
jgi:uncharacterized membrane protein